MMNINKDNTNDNNVSHLVRNMSLNHCNIRLKFNQKIHLIRIYSLKHINDIVIAGLNGNVSIYDYNESFKLNKSIELLDDGSLKFPTIKPWYTLSNLGTITCIENGNIFNNISNPKENILAICTTAGNMYIYHFINNTIKTNILQIPSNSSDMLLISNIIYKNNKTNLLIFGTRSREIHIYKGYYTDDYNPNLQLLHKVNVNAQIISLAYNIIQYNDQVYIIIGTEQGNIIYSLKDECICNLSSSSSSLSIKKYYT